MTKKLNPRMAFALGALILVFVGGIVWLMMTVGNREKPQKKERKIQAITMVKPPPPPPPPPKVEKPPEPEEAPPVEQKAEPEPQEEIPDVADEAPPGDLGLDAEGTAGSDAFGLAARKGGKGLFGGGGNPYAWFGNLIKNDLQSILSENEDLKSKDYSAVVKLWVDSDGKVSRFELANGSNDPDIDALLKKLIGRYAKVDQPPPPGMEQPVKLQITSRT